MLIVCFINRGSCRTGFCLLLNWRGFIRARNSAWSFWFSFKYTVSNKFCCEYSRAFCWYWLVHFLFVRGSVDSFQDLVFRLARSYLSPFHISPVITTTCFNSTVLSSHKDRFLQHFCRTQSHGIFGVIDIILFIRDWVLWEKHREQKFHGACGSIFALSSKHVGTHFSLHVVHKFCHIGSLVLIVWQWGWRFVCLQVLHVGMQLWEAPVYKQDIQVSLFLSAYS